MDTLVTNTVREHGCHFVTHVHMAHGHSLWTRVVSTEHKK